jgi:hypothetical protein
MAASKRNAEQEKIKTAESDLQRHTESKPKRMSAEFRDYYEERTRELAQRAYELNPSQSNAAALSGAMGAQAATARRKQSRIEKQERMAREAEEAKLAEQVRLETRQTILEGGV